ncbi:MAG: PASTA domain-containing protein [Ferruginibacter sp.]|jgi:beta-lactam-binding protein with PASTA domain
MFKFITNRPFWVNLLVAAMLAFLLIFLTLEMLGWVTKHGEYLTVPSVKGKSTEEAKKLLESKGFDVTIQDSVFTDSLQRGIVIKQLPDAEATVKVNRTVFLTVNRYMPPMVVMPELEGKSLGFALDLLQRSHLQLGDTTFKPDFMKGSILEQQYNGKKIEAGEKVIWGSKISLVIAGGLQDEQIMVPELVGKTFAEGKITLEALGVNVGAVIAKDAIKDTANAFIYRQNPDRYNDEKKPVYIHPGQLMDIYISKEMILPDSVTINKN